MIVQILLAFALGACYAPLPEPPPVGAHGVRPLSPADLAQQFEHDIKIVAADDMEGRGLGTKGIDRAAAFLETRLRELKLQPAFGTSFKQPFEVKTGVEMGEGNRLDVGLPAGHEAGHEGGQARVPVLHIPADAWTPL